MNSFNKKISNMFWIASVFAIYFVIYAHYEFTNPYLVTMMEMIGGVGVPIFLIRSGFFLNKEENNKTFFIKKIKNILLPWLIFAPVGWALTLTNNPSNLSIEGFLYFILGFRSWLYFPIILMIYYVLFKFIKWDFFIYLSFILFIISLSLDEFGINPFTNISTQYINFFNRIGYFAIGLLLRKYCEQFEKSLNKSVIYISIFIVSIILLFVGTILYKGHKAPNFITVPFSILFALCILDVSYFIKRNRISDAISKNTYFIYFFHMQFGIFLTNFVLKNLHLYNNRSLLIYAPILTIGFAYLLLIGFRFVFKLLRKEKYLFLLGIK